MKKEHGMMTTKTNPFTDVATVVVPMLGAARGTLIVACLLAAFASVVTPQAAHSQDLTIDDFSTGAGRVGPMIGGTRLATQSGATILGGTRTEKLILSDNEFLQPTQVEFRPSKNRSVPSAMIWSNSYKAFPRLELYYGPLNLDLTSFDRLRVTFDGQQQLLNFNVEAFDINNHYAILPCPQLSLYQITSFTVDLPRANFQGTIDWTNIKTIALIFQGGILGSPNLALTSIAALPASDPQGTVTCHN